MDMKHSRFGIELEMSGITREQAANTVATVIGGSAGSDGSGNYAAIAPDGRVWQLVRDGSLHPLKKVNGNIIAADGNYSVELVSPILTYANDMETLQEIVRALRKAGAFTEGVNAGCHLHLDSAPHTPRSVRNFINIMASKNDLLYKALEVDPERVRYCKALDARLVERMNKEKPTTMEHIARIWYAGYTGSQTSRYHQSRYSALNCHPVFNGHGTIEIRAMNSSLHAGVVRAYVCLALALNHQALTQKCASSRKGQQENERFAMRTYLNRIGLVGDEYKSCREHLTKALSGNSAWRHFRAAA